MRHWMLLFLTLVAFSACHTDRWGGKAVSEKGVKVARYDRLQYEATTMNSFSALQKMNLAFPQVTKLLIEDVLELGTVGEPDINERLCTYYADTTLQHLMNDVMVCYEDVSDLEKGLTAGFRQLKKWLPELVVPQVYTQISALNQSVVVGDSLLGISLDKYLGADYPLYRRYYYPYQCRSMVRERILTDGFAFYLMGQYPFGWHLGHRTLLDVLMYRGKIYWVVNRLLDGISVEDMLGYTDEEKDWCKDNRQKLWKWLLTGGLLSSTDPMLVRAFTHAEPGLSFEGKPVPPVVGVWLGIRLVDSYMKQHSRTDVAQLLGQSDFSDISTLTP